MTTSKQLADIRSTATGLRSALRATQSCVPAPTIEAEATDVEWADTLFVLAKLTATLAEVLTDGGADLDVQAITSQLSRFRAHIEGERA